MSNLSPTRKFPDDSLDIERVIEFLSQCGDTDIEAGIGALLGHGTEQRLQHFKDGLSSAIRHAGVKKVEIEL